jgi:HEAT repeat protein
MTSFRRITSAVLLTVSCLSLSRPLQAQGEDPYQALHHYDYQNRKSLDAITKQIQEAGQDKTKQAAIEAGLLGVLQDSQSTPGGKQEACRFLWEIGTAKSVPVLAKMLADPATHDMARYALERNPDPAAGAALQTALTTTKGTQLIGVINSVGNRGEAQAVSKLKALSNSKDALVADAAINALGKVGTSASVAVLRSLPQTNPTVSSSLLRSADKLAASGKKTDATALYTSLTKATYPEVIRAGALNGLAALNVPETGTLALTIALSAQEPTLQRVAARVLGMQTSPGELKRATGAWNRLPAPAQVALLSAWSDRNERAASGIVAEALKSQTPEVGAAAIRAARVTGAAVVPTLAEFAAGGEHAQVARETLAHLSGNGIEKALLMLAGQGKPEVRAAVIGVLAERPTAAVTTTLLKVAEEKDARVASAALKTLGRTATMEQEMPLVKILVSTEDEDVRDAAQSAIAAIAQRSGDRDKAAEPLLAAMAQASPAGKAAILSTLADLGGDRALEVITQAMTSGDETVKSAALSGLANTWSDTRALPVLLQLSKNGASKADRVLALRGYLRLVGADERAPGEERLSRVQEALAVAERPEEKRQALSVLREIRLPGAVAQATQLLDNPELITEASDAILYLAAPRRRGNRNLPAVQGVETQQALDKVIQVVKDENVLAEARKLRQK